MLGKNLLDMSQKVRIGAPGIDHIQHDTGGGCCVHGPNETSEPGIPGKGGLLACPGLRPIDVYDDDIVRDAPGGTPPEPFVEGPAFEIVKAGKNP